MATIFFGDANLPWIRPLCDELAKHTLTIRIAFSVNLRGSISGLLSSVFNSNRGIQNWAYPPGFNSFLSSIYKPLISRRLNRVIEEVLKKSNQLPFVVISDVGLSKYLRNVECRIVYLIYDLYSTEGQRLDNHNFLMKRSEKVLCSSLELSSKFKLENPEFIDKIYYFPHGSNEKFLNKELAEQDVEPNVVINGYLTARYDWDIIYYVVSEMKDIKFVFVGAFIPSDFGKSPEFWVTLFKKVIALPNVHHISDLPHELTVRYYRESSIVWLPYDSRIEFNRYSCPMKIMDGLSSGRPVISTGIPESKNHAAFIQICDDASGTVQKMRYIIDHSTDAESINSARVQLGYAKQNSWANRAIQYLNILK